MVFDKYFNEDTFTFKSGILDSIDELNALKGVKQSEKWHKEGDAYIHTMLCLEHAFRILSEEFIKENRFTLRDCRILVMAVLFHDLGKATKTEFSNGDWHSYGHEIDGEKIARKILWDEEFTARESVCSLIRFHMERCGIMRGGDIANKIMKLSWLVNLKKLLFVGMCDIFGSIQNDEHGIERDIRCINIMGGFAKSLNCLDKPFVFDDDNFMVSASEIERSEITCSHIFDGTFPFKDKTQSPKPVMTIMVGLSGAGKDTYISDRLSDGSTVVLCRDNIRAEIGLCGVNEKIVGTPLQEKKVTEIFNARLNEALIHGVDVVINNINLKKKYRSEYIRVAKNNGYDVKCVYVEAPTLKDNNERHKGQVSMDILNKMILNLDFPRADEFGSEIIIEKQSKVN